MIASSPSALSKLKELSEALGADAGFSAAVTNLTGNKANTADVYNKTSVFTVLNSKQVTLHNGGGSVPNPVYMYNGVINKIKYLKGGSTG